MEFFNESPIYGEPRPRNDEPTVVPTSARVVEMACLGDQIARLSAHLDTASARLLDLIRKFDAQGGWNNGFSSCAAWLSWRVGLDLGTARSAGYRAMVATTQQGEIREGRRSARGPMADVMALRDAHVAATRPNGRPFPQVPAAPAIPGEPSSELEKFAEEHDLGIGPDSLRATDGGRHFDLGWALDVLHPRSDPIYEEPQPPSDRLRRDDGAQPDDGTSPEDETS